MNSAVSIVDETDAELVAATLRGDREAFARIIARYQSLICSLTYSATGDLARSEDLAQETFLAAWKGLRQLSEPAKLKSWLCGIARNLAYNSLRKAGREPVAHSDGIAALQNTAAPEPSPMERTISNEEQALMWNALAGIPETYREPMVLFYREQQSIERVAAALELSEDAVKQRLSRGRKLLTEQMTALVERSLKQSVPGRAFTYAVLASLPMLAGTASAATIGAAAAKGSTVAKTAGMMAFIGAILGPIAGVMGAWLGVKASLDSARSNEERKEIIRCAKLLIAYIGGFLAVLLGVMLPPFWKQNPPLFAAALVILWSGYVIGLFAMIFYVNSRIRKVRHQIHRDQPKASSARPNYSYRSRVTIFGIPLIDVKSGSDENGRACRAMGWIAFGDFAFGLIACGGVAVGALSFGGVAIGIFSFGGFAAGVLALGGFALGHHVLAGLGVGMVGFGGLVVAWKMAVGGLAVAHEIAHGGLALAQHANDAIARDAVEASSFIRRGKWFAEQGTWMAWIPVLLAFWFTRRIRRRKQLGLQS